MDSRAYRVIVIASLAGLLFGFDTAVIAGVTQALRSTYSLSAVALGNAVAAALWGTLLGAVAAGVPGDRFGSRAVLRVIAALYVVSAIGCALAMNLPMFIVCRFLTGLAIGGSSVLAPVYLSELAPANRRGAVVGLFQFNIVFGILLAYLSNFAIDGLTATSHAWRWKLFAAALPAIVFWALLRSIPPSPRWLHGKGRRDQARSALERLGETDPDLTLQRLDQAALNDDLNSGGESLSWRRHRRPIVTAVLLAMFNQLSGINAILYYSGDIFAAAGFSSWSADLQSVAIGITNLLATLAGMTLIDRVGRRQLLLWGALGMSAALTGVALVMGSTGHRPWLLPLLVAFIISFAMSQGAVIWVYLSEVFPTAVRARGQSLGSATHWAMNAVIATTFPAIAAWSAPAPFAFFAAMMLAQLLFVATSLRETRGLELERIGDPVR